MQEQIVKALQWRYAVQVFDQTKQVSETDLRTILESGRLAPSSTGTEPWQFIVVENPEIRQKLRAVSYDQPKVTEASHLIVIASRTDIRENITRERVERTAQVQNQSVESLAGLQQMLEGNISRRDDVNLSAWMERQSYIPLGMMVETASLLGIDSAPMDGFDPKGVDGVLGLSARHLTATALLALGYRSDTDTAMERPKVRRSFDEVVTFVK